MADTHIFGYADPLSPKAGTRVDFMVSVEGRAQVEAQIVRLIHGDENPIGPGFLEAEIATELTGTLAVKRQYVQLGAFADCDDPDGRLDGLESFTLFAHVTATLIKNERQQIMGRWLVNDNKGYGLGLTPEGKFCFWVGDGAQVDQITSDLVVTERAWYFVAAGYDADTGKATLRVINCINAWNSRVSTVVPLELNSWIEEPLRVKPAATGGDATFKLAGASEANPARGRFTSLLFNGKIDRAGVCARVLTPQECEAAATGTPPTNGLLAYWDPTANLKNQGVGDQIPDTGPNGLHMNGVNRPIRCMTGFNWQGEDSYRLAPETYGGVHYHDDALTDAKWDITCSLDLPADMRSGAYALRLRGGGVEDHIPFIVTPAKPKAKIAVLLPTFTYLAYANEHLSYEAPIAQAIVAHTPVISQIDLEYKKLEEFGLSTYDHHSDGAGCCYSSWRRPIVSLRPRYRLSAMNFPWCLPADLSLLWWLDKAGYEYDVITDHDLHAHGKAALIPYKTVINGTHPEYYSEEMMDGTEEYLSEGGRVLYLGGNGYYWVSGLRDAEDHCMEVRKLDTGSRAWQAEPGEGYLASTGQRSGLWRSRGRAPQKIVGLGFTTEGMDMSEPYERMPDSFHKRVGWIMDGIGDEEKIGDFGLGAGGGGGD